MKEILQQYGSYHLWAHEKLLTATLGLSEEQQKQELQSSFRSLYLTYLHLWDAESTWWQRVRLQEQIILPSRQSALTMQEIANGLVNQSKQWDEFIAHSTTAALEHVFAYYNSKREYCKNEVWKTLLHVFNHGTYHRGQVVNILHQLNITKIPNTDFIAWCRAYAR